MPIDPFTGAAILQGGGQILGGIGSYLGGGAQRRREREADEFRKQSRERINQLFGQFQAERELFDPERFIEQIQRDISPQLERTASRIIRNQGSLGGVGGKRLLATQKDLLGGRLIGLGERERSRRGSELQRMLSLFGGFV
jgi:hypothetical protein